MDSRYFYHDKPLFGLDIGFNSIKVIQIAAENKKRVIVGYGVASFDPQAIRDGVIIDYEKVAKPIQELFTHHLTGEVTTRRVALSIPATRTYTRVLSLPKLAAKDLSEAVRSEAQQYIPVPLDGLYIDYEIIASTEKTVEVLAVAISQRIVDSYMQLAKLLGLEVIALETTTGATGRLFVYSDQSNIPTVLIDFGSIASDITVFDKGLVVTGTVGGGGDDFTRLISEKLGVTPQEAHLIKIKYGLNVSKKQQEVVTAVSPILQQLVKEIRRMIRYHEERSGSREKIGQIITLGGGANIPGLSEYLTDALRLPVRMCNPWGHITFGHLQPPSDVEKSMYITAAGLALIQPKEVFVA